MAIDRLSVTTADPGDACDLLQQAYESDGTMIYGRGLRSVAVSYDLRTCGDLHAARLHHSTVPTSLLTPVPDLLVGTVLGGRLRCHQDRETPAFASAGDVLLYPVTGARMEMDWDDLDLALVRIPRAAVARAALERYGPAAASFSFDDIVPLTRSAGRQWSALSRFLYQQLAAGDSLLDRDLPRSELVSLLASTAVRTFPSAFVDDHLAGRGTVGPRTVRQAALLIEDYACESFTVSDLAAAVGADPAALRQAFRVRYAVTPMQYLRRVRLELAYRELELGGADDQESVTEIAARAGFLSAAGFQTAFTERFGTTPEVVLRRGRAD